MSSLLLYLVLGAIDAHSFEPAIGEWRIAEIGGQKGYLVDGTSWRQGTPSVGLADQAKRLYGEKYAEFLDGVKAFAFFPLAIYTGDCKGEHVTLSTRFYPNAGRIDQAAGIAWNIAPDGSYYGARANALENNVLFFKVVRGKRSVLNVIRDVKTPSRVWQTLKIKIDGRHVEVFLDEKSVFAKDTDAPSAGRCGLWSKADSQVLFDDFTVEN